MDLLLELAQNKKLDDKYGAAKGARLRGGFEDIKDHLDSVTLDGGGLQGIYKKLLKYARRNKYGDKSEIKDRLVRKAVDQALEATDKAFFPWTGHLKPYSSVREEINKGLRNFHKRLDSNAGFRYNNTVYKTKRRAEGKTKRTLSKSDCYDDLLRDADALAVHWKNNTVEEADESYNIDNISNSDYASSNGSSPQYPDKSGRNKVSDSTDPERVESSASYITPNELPVTDIYFKAKQSENKHAYSRTKLPNDIKTRLVCAPDAHYVLASQLVLRPLQNEYDSRPWLPCGSGVAGTDGGKYRYNFITARSFLENENSDDIKTAMIDYQGYDSSVDAWVIKEQYQSIKNYFDFGDERDEWHNFIDNLRNEFINSKFMMPDGFIFAKTRGVTSGAYETTYINSRVNYFYIQFGAIYQQLLNSGTKLITKILGVVVSGDDCLVRSRNFNFDQFRSHVKTHFNATVHSDPKTVINPAGQLEGLQFCGYQVRLDEHSQPMTYRDRHVWFEKIILSASTPNYKKTDQKELLEKHKALNLYKCDESAHCYEHPWSTQRQLENFQEIGALSDPLFKIYYDAFYEKYLDEICFYLD